MNQDNEAVGQSDLKDGEPAKNETNEYEIRDTAYVDTQEMMTKMYKILSDYIEKECPVLNHNTKFLVASRAVSGLHWGWINHIHKEQALHLIKLQELDGYPKI